MSQLLPALALGCLLADVTRLLRQSLETAFVQSGLNLTVGDFRTLAYVIAHEGSRQSVLADLMGFEQMTLSHFVSRLQKQDLVTRRVDPTNSRARVIHPTKQGQKAYAEAQPIVEAICRQATISLSAHQIRTVEANLVAMRINLGR